MCSQVSSSMEHGVTADWLGSAYRETVQLFMQRDTLTKKAWKLNLVENGAGIVMKSGNNVCLIRGVKGERKKGDEKGLGYWKLMTSKLLTLWTLVSTNKRKSKFISFFPPLPFISKLLIVSWSSVHSNFLTR